jgi:methylglyoxal synthase
MNTIDIWIETPMIGKTIALVAPDYKKKDLIEWAKYNRNTLAHHQLLATGTTGTLLEQELEIPVTKLKSGPLGGDQQIGARISDGEVDFLIFFWDPMSQMPHDPDVKALLRIAIVWNIPVACNRTSAEYVISSPLMWERKKNITPDFREYEDRVINF